MTAVLKLPGFSKPHLYYDESNRLLVMIASSPPIYYNIGYNILPPPCSSQTLISDLKTTSKLLVGGLEHQFYFPIYWESSSQLTFIFFRGVAQPPTRFQFIQIGCTRTITIWNWWIIIPQNANVFRLQVVPRFVDKKSSRVRVPGT